MKEICIQITISPRNEGNILWQVNNYRVINQKISYYTCYAQTEMYRVNKAKNRLRHAHLVCDSLYRVQTFEYLHELIRVPPNEQSAGLIIQALHKVSSSD
jgi:hypothetical protein